MPNIVDKQHLNAAQEIKEHLATYENNRELIQIGAYKHGTNSDSGDFNKLTDLQDMTEDDISQVFVIQQIVSNQNDASLEDLDINIETITKELSDGLDNLSVSPDKLENVMEELKGEFEDVSKKRIIYLTTRNYLEKLKSCSCIIRGTQLKI